MRKQKETKGVWKKSQICEFESRDGANTRLIMLKTSPYLDIVKLTSFIVFFLINQLSVNDRLKIIFAISHVFLVDYDFVFCVQCYWEGYKFITFDIIDCRCNVESFRIHSIK